MVDLASLQITSNWGTKESKDFNKNNIYNFLKNENDNEKINTLLNMKLVNVLIFSPFKIYQIIHLISTDFKILWKKMPIIFAKKILVDLFSIYLTLKDILKI